MKIKVFWNINELANWEKVFNQQWECMVKSGLAEAADDIILMGNGRIKSFIPLVDSRPEYKNLAFTSVCDSATLWEYPSLMFMWTQVQESKEPFHALYIHLKGLTRWGNAAVDDWRDFLNWSVIERWQDNVKALETHDTSGPNWQNDPWPHYSANFWWANSDYIAKLPKLVHPHVLVNLNGTQFKPHPTIPHWRFDHEAWIGSANPNHYEIAKSFAVGGDHYSKPYPRNLYRND